MIRSSIPEAAIQVPREARAARMARLRPPA
jgi:hypothetical protein